MRLPDDVVRDVDELLEAGFGNIGGGRGRWRAGGRLPYLVGDDLEAAARVLGDAGPGGARRR